MKRSKSVKAKGVPSYFRDHSNRMIDAKISFVIDRLTNVSPALERGAVGDARGHVMGAHGVLTDLLIEFSEYLGAHMQRHDDHQKKKRKK